MEIYIATLVIAILVFLFYYYYTRTEGDVVAILKEEYEQSLKGQNRRVALDAGRAYYRVLHPDKKLTVYDEQAIANDLSTMT